MEIGDGRALMIMLLTSASCGGSSGTANVPKGDGSALVDGGGDSGTVGDAPDGAFDDVGAKDGETSIDGALDSTGDGAGIDAESLPRCIGEGGLSFAMPVLLAESGGTGGRTIAANDDGKVAMVTRSNGRCAYMDSLNGGRSFRPAMVVSQLGFDNLAIALGPRHVYITTGLLDLAASVMLAAAELDTLQDESQFLRVQFGPWGTYAATPVPAPNGQLALFLANASLGGGPEEGTYVSVVKTPLGTDYSQPKQLFWPGVCVAGLWHSSGALYMAYPLEGEPPRFEVRWSTDDGSTFSAPVAQPSSGGALGCPKLYEQVDGNLLLITRERNNLSSTERVLAHRFDNTTKQFTRTVTAFPDGKTLCFDAARASTGRTYLAVTAGDPGVSALGVSLSYSDDDGATWTPPFAVPYLRSDTICPSLAASHSELYFVWSRKEEVWFSRAGGASACD